MILVSIWDTHIKTYKWLTNNVWCIILTAECSMFINHQLCTAPMHDDMQCMRLLTVLIKAVYQDIRATCYYFQKHLKSTAQRDVWCVQVQAVQLATWYLPHPQLSFDRALYTPYDGRKWRLKLISKGETNWCFCAAQYPRNIDFASSLAQSWAQCYTSWSGMDKWCDPDITKPQHAERVYEYSHFPGPKK